MGKRRYFDAPFGTDPAGGESLAERFRGTVGGKHSPAPTWRVKGSARGSFDIIRPDDVTDTPAEMHVNACLSACEGLDLPADVPVGALREAVEALCELRALLPASSPKHREAFAAASAALSALGVEP